MNLDEIMWGSMLVGIRIRISGKYLLSFLVYFFLKI